MTASQIAEMKMMANVLGWGDDTGSTGRRVNSVPRIDVSTEVTRLKNELGVITQFVRQLDDKLNRLNNENKRLKVELGRNRATTRPIDDSSIRERESRRMDELSAKLDDIRNNYISNNFFKTVRDKINENFTIFAEWRKGFASAWRKDFIMFEARIKQIEDNITHEV